MIQCRAVIKGEWKLIFVPPPYGENDWHLYNLSEDPREMTNLVEEQPEKFLELKAEWDAYAASVGYIKAGEVKQLNGMSPEEFFRFKRLQ